MAYARPDAVPVTGRQEVAMKYMIRELALVLGIDDIVVAAHAAGTDRTATRLKAEIEARFADKAPNQPQA